MSQCFDLILQGDGSVKFVPIATQDLKTCNYVVQNGAEVGSSISDLTPAQGLEIGGYIGALWAMAWGIKQISKTFNIGDSNEQND